jgi:hypothetical protein
METSIRYVRIGNEHTDSSSKIKPALCFRGKKQAYAVINDETRVRVVTVPLPYHDSAVPVLFKRADYPLSKFIETMERIGKKKGKTQRADYFLAWALEGGPEESAPMPPDEDYPGGDLGKIADAIMGRDPAPPEPSERPQRSPGTPKPAKPPSEPVRKPGGTLIARLAAEFGLEPPKLRKLLRSKGMHAPYEDEKAIRKAAGK